MALCGSPRCAQSDSPECILCELDELILGHRLVISIYLDFHDAAPELHTDRTDLLSQVNADVCRIRQTAYALGRRRWKDVGRIVRVIGVGSYGDVFTLDPDRQAETALGNARLSRGRLHRVERGRSENRLHLIFGQERTRRWERLRGARSGLRRRGGRTGRARLRE